MVRQRRESEGGGTYSLSGLELALGLCFPNALKMLCFFKLFTPRQAK